VKLPGVSAALERFYRRRTADLPQVMALEPPVIDVTGPTPAFRGKNCLPDRLDEEELADWRAGRDAIYQLAALTVGARLAVADG